MYYSAYTLPIVRISRRNLEGGLPIVVILSRNLEGGMHYIRTTPAPCWPRWKPHTFED
jgi:hypothetical protein